MKNSIEVDNLSKAYQLGQFGTGTISRDLERWWALIRGKEDPMLKVGELNLQNRRSNNEIVWSLKNVNFEIQKGDAVGIIGKNGAGKSTLLKVLSQITSPTSGSVKIKGRVASLLEVGTGFHPELTGRENIYLNGAILGMKKNEISKKFDEIVDFAGVNNFVDTPVKRYSSGMYVRLAFAVAANLESEILIVDEVLAVGDSEFQNKCVGKMNNISKEDGRTILFVSHNMESIKALCNKGILIENGCVLNSSSIKNVIQQYKVGSNDESQSFFKNDNILSKEVVIIEAQIIIDEDNTNIYSNGSSFDIALKLKGNIDTIFSIETIVKNQNKEPILFSPLGLAKSVSYKIKNNEELFLKINYSLPFLASGKYYLDIMTVNSGIKIFHNLENILSFKIEDNYIKNTGWNFKQDRGQGSILLESNIRL
jgi:lipopolysaccharide transport system ATP-binding protein